jgi:cell wall-associated NlpC family hydrolase
VLERDRRALAETGLAAGTVRTRVTRLEATQAEAVGLRQVRVALDRVGKPYRWGATGPESFDCATRPGTGGRGGSG